MKKEIKFYAITSVLQATEKDALYAIKSPTDTTFRLAVTDLGGTVVYLSESNLAITSTDGSIDISTIASTKDLKVSTALQNAINNALQSGDPISSLLNDAGYLTSFTESDPIFLASEASNFVDGDKSNLDNQSGINTGDETIITIQTKRPLKTINNNSIEGAGNLNLITGVQSIVAGTNVTVDNTDPLNPIVSAESSTIISKFVFNEVPLGTIDGINSIFNTSFLLVPDTEIVFINGQKQKKPDDYNISGQTITFTFSPGIGESLTINYIKQ